MQFAILDAVGDAVEVAGQLAERADPFVGVEPQLRLAGGVAAHELGALPQRVAGSRSWTRETATLIALIARQIASRADATRVRRSPDISSGQTSAGTIAAAESAPAKRSRLVSFSERCSAEDKVTTSPAITPTLKLLRLASSLRREAVFRGR